MNFDQLVQTMADRDQKGLLANIIEDFLYSRRHHDDAVLHSSAILKLRKMARGQNVPVDHEMTNTAEELGKWIDNNLR